MEEDETKLTTVKAYMIWVLIIAVVAITALALIGNLTKVDSINTYETLSNESNFTYTSATSFTVGTGLVSTSSQTRNNSWLKFDGRNAFLNISNAINLNLTKGFSFSVFAKTVYNSSAGNRFFSFQNLTGASPAILFGILDSSGISQYFIQVNINGTGCNSGQSSTGFAKNDNAWHHIVGSFNGTAELLYVDGVINKTFSYSDECVTRLNGTAQFLFRNSTIGASATGGFFYAGFLDEVRIYNRSLTAVEIAEINNSGRIANSSLVNDSLPLWYSFDEISGTTVYDKSGSGNNGV